MTAVDRGQVGNLAGGQDKMEFRMVTGSGGARRVTETSLLLIYCLPGSAVSWSAEAPRSKIVLHAVLKMGEEGNVEHSGE